MNTPNNTQNTSEKLPAEFDTNGNGNGISDDAKKFLITGSVMKDCYRVAKSIHEEMGIENGDVEACAHSLFIDLSRKGFQRGGQYDQRIYDALKQDGGVT